MLLAQVGKKIILGLEQENVDRLLNDMPIERSLDEVDGLGEGWTVYVLGPEDTARFIARVGGTRGH